MYESLKRRLIIYPASEIRVKSNTLNYFSLNGPQEYVIFAKKTKNSIHIQKELIN